MAPPRGDDIEPMQPRDRGLVGRYRPCFKLASGGMASVYLARATTAPGFHRFVALKRIRQDLADSPSVIEMFLDEAQILAQIVHPNVCSVYDFEAEPGRYSIVMEFLMGEPVSRIAEATADQTDPVVVEKTCALSARIIADACEGLHAAHDLCDARGVHLQLAHRDVSPQNLFVTYDGAVKVVDFGIVRAAACRRTTRMGVIKGKYAYVAPEVMRGNDADRRADIWSAGVVLWELATGMRLFRRRTDMDTLEAVMDFEIPAPSTIRAGVPSDIDEIVLRALARDPNDRYQTARQLGRDLVHFLHARDEPVDLADVSAAMGELFSGCRERKLRLLEIAAGLDSEAAFSFDDASSSSSHHSTESAEIAAPIDSAPREMEKAPAADPDWSQTIRDVPMAVRSMVAAAEGPRNPRSSAVTVSFSFMKATTRASPKATRGAAAKATAAASKATGSSPAALPALPLHPRRWPLLAAFALVLVVGVAVVAASSSHSSARERARDEAPLAATSPKAAGTSGAALPDPASMRAGEAPPPRDAPAATSARRASPRAQRSAEPSTPAPSATLQPAEEQAPPPEASASQPTDPSAVF